MKRTPTSCVCGSWRRGPTVDTAVCWSEARARRSAGGRRLLRSRGASGHIGVRASRTGRARPPSGRAVLRSARSDVRDRPVRRAGRADHQVYDHTSIIATILRRFVGELPSELGPRPALANHRGHVLTLDESQASQPVVLPPLPPMLQRSGRHASTRRASTRPSAPSPFRRRDDGRSSRAGRGSGGGRCGDHRPTRRRERVAYGDVRRTTRRRDHATTRPRDDESWRCRSLAVITTGPDGGVRQSARRVPRPAPCE
jgi:hypothetical protein